VEVQSVAVPALGFGTWQLTGRAAEEGVRDALEIGYRHIDTARMYGNERVSPDVGRARRPLACAAMLPLKTIVAAGLAATALPAAAAEARTTTFKVVTATHTSSAAKTDGTRYSGSSTADWKLAKPAKLQISTVAGHPVGQVWLKVRGTFTAQATTDWPGSCSVTAPTGSTQYSAVAPGLVPLSIGPDPNGTHGTLAAFQGVQATLANPYFGTECATDVSGEPSLDTTALRAISPRLLRRRTITLHYTGSTDAEGIAYRWATKFTLRRMGRA
jgi:hypothetical protein